MHIYRLFLFPLLISLTVNICYSDERQFQIFLNNFINQKLKKNIYGDEFITNFKKNSYFIKRVVELDRSQPEFKLTLNQYLNKVVTKNRVNKAVNLYLKNKVILDKISKFYKIQPRFIVALWGIETDFGRVTGSFPVISSLMTLIFDGRRANYFEKELFYALDIVKDGHVKMKNMYGSWAGAMGQCQFMPSSFTKYAQDWNKDGKKDIWKTKEDVFASAANYLKNTGWNNKENWGRKVYLKNVNSKINSKSKFELSYFKKLGVLNSDKKNLPNANIKARLIYVNNRNYGYLAYKNFDNLLKWNRSNYFVIAVGTLSDQILLRANK